MELTFYGVRGSYPTARRDQIKYGGNTTCLHFSSRSGQNLILDGGSGIRVLGNRLEQQEFGQGQGEATILVGHTHWDHILGYPFFKPFFHKGNRFLFVSAGQPGAHVRDILSGQYADLNFPISFDRLDADLEFQAVNPGDGLTLGDFHIETVQLNHPGITVGYRIEADGSCATIFTDTGRIRRVRLGDGMEGAAPDREYAENYLKQLAHCARQSDVLVHDTQFLEYEMVGRYDWGHSTIEDAIEMARMAEVKALVLFHHAPEHSDMVVDEQLALAQDLTKWDSFSVTAAAEGSQLEIGRTEERL